MEYARESPGASPAQAGKGISAPGAQLRRIARVRLPGRPPSTLWDLSIAEGKISAVEPHHARTTGCILGPDVLDGANRLLAPSLCHAHVHLDKCFLLQDPKFSDLQIEHGDFQEAMKLTGEAKARFAEEDLLRRGRQLIRESISHGVTAMRAFVEVDEIVRFKCLDAGLLLKREFKHLCKVQICAFAQLPLFSGRDGGAPVRGLMADAARREGVEALGSTPYVEQDENKSKMNIRWITALALTHSCHLDLHLDYFLEASKPPLVFNVLDTLKERNWAERSDKRVALGHCTRLMRFKEGDWHRLKQEIDASSLPISFVGLPTSDLFMMRTKEMLRGTLPVVDMIQRYGLEAAIAINNVGNAFTPQGTCDPLGIASLGVGLYQAGTKQGAEILYQTVSSRAKAAIGCPYTSLALTVGEPADFVMFDSMDSSWRCRKTVCELVYDAGSDRLTVFGGMLSGA